MPTLHLCSSLNNCIIKIAIEEYPAIASFKIINCLRLKQSTQIPAKFETTKIGTSVKNVIQEIGVTSFVSCQIQIISAKRVIPEPIREAV